MMGYVLPRQLTSKYAPFGAFFISAIPAACHLQF